MQPNSFFRGLPHFSLRCYSQVFAMIFFAYSSLTAQIQEVGVGVVGSFFSGDVGPKLPYMPQGLGIKAIYKYHFTDRMSVSVNGVYSSISAYDRNSGDDIRKLRDQSFVTSLGEISVFFEFNFWKFKALPTLRNVAYTPYIRGGMGVFFYDKKVISAKHRWISIAGVQRAPTTPYDFVSIYTPGSVGDYSFTLPFGVGFKFLFYRHIMVDLSLALRYTFTDDLDSNDPLKEGYYIEPVLAREPFATVIKGRDLARYGGFGNTVDTDWYAFLGVTVSYVFGDLPCACGQ